MYGRWRTASSASAPFKIYMGVLIGVSRASGSRQGLQGGAAGIGDERRDAKLSGLPVRAQGEAIADTRRIERTRKFAHGVIVMQRPQACLATVRTGETTGKYEGVAAAGYHYRITSYYDAGTGRLLSRIQRDARLPEAIHIAEVMSTTPMAGWCEISFPVRRRGDPAGGRASRVRRPFSLP